MGDAESRRKLENALGKLLGFEEGEAEDLLEHLFTIDSDTDLSEYLVQLLGDQTLEMLNFVENMSRYRSGESIASVAENQGEADQKESSEKSGRDSPTQETAALDSFRAMAMGNNTRTAKKNAGRKNTKEKQGSKSRVPPPKNVNSRKKQPQNPSSDTNQSQNTVVSPASNQSPTLHQKEEKGVVEKSHPARGKAKVVCGCFGTKYKALTNCLYCGRIICEAEGYGFCPFCGFMVEEAVDGNGKAFLQKERLLRFDRDFARRTQIFDDQADYQAPSTWMTEEEKEEAEENQRNHLESLKRPKQRLNLAI
eukprot:CAMPEP_0116120132 /NCGR_PEP_ID=MMETSP0329-20121206/3016_1 /TAXON_ID=697910 /ORGANISM="Pseudo-nitzschia arenysensis, Strain B593" /LENGTH=308 /DNA_ID=CAMNT_0003613889 /DNA_START=187 /DNA_END=1113 /DNA_ORIENTATION=+